MLLVLGVGLQGLFTFLLRQPVLGWLALMLCVWPYRTIVVITRAGLSVRWLAFHRDLPAVDVLGAELGGGYFGGTLTIRVRRAPELALRGPPELLLRLRADLLTAFEVR